MKPGYCLCLIMAVLLNGCAETPPLAGIFAEHQHNIWVVQDSNKIPASTQEGRSLARNRCRERDASAIPMDHIYTLNGVSYTRYICGTQRQ